MKILMNEPIKNYTTFKIGGIAKRFIIPESIPELIDAINAYGCEYCIGGGSNLLISDREYDSVILLRSFNDSITNIGEGMFAVGASARLQTLILRINSEGYGGIEYLFSVPGLIGGAVVMNAGGGIEQGCAISDYIVSVKYLDNGQVKVLSREECDFKHRNSIFRKNTDWIILEVTFQFKRCHRDELKNKRIERIEYCKKYQDASKPNFGSVFSESNPYVMEFIRRISKKTNKSVHYSSKSANWLINEGDGSFDEAMRCITYVKKIHKLFKLKCKEEVIIWK